MYQINNRIIAKIIILLLIVQFQSSCRKFVEIGTPPDKISQENAFSTDRSAIAVLTGIYIDLGSAGASMAKYAGLLGDEWTLWTGGNLHHIGYFAKSGHSFRI